MYDNKHFFLLSIYFRLLKARSKSTNIIFSFYYLPAVWKKSIFIYKHNNSYNNFFITLNLILCTNIVSKYHRRVFATKYQNLPLKFHRISSAPESHTLFASLGPSSCSSQVNAYRIHGIAHDPISREEFNTRARGNMLYTCIIIL